MLVGNWVSMEVKDPSTPGHRPVLAAEVMQYLNVQPGATIVDATVGLGGHSVLIAERLGKEGTLVAIDQDEESLRTAQQRVSGCKVHWVHNNFANVWSVLRGLQIPSVDGLLADLGVSSPQLDRPERGFSFRQEGPLDMRMDGSRGETAADLLHRLSERELARIFWEFGEERYSRRVASKIVEARKSQSFRTTTQLAQVVREAIPRQRGPKGKRGPSIDPATRVFQALRIAVNDELGALDALLDSLGSVIHSGGRAVLISFHSLEDRRVKNAFRNRDQWSVLTKKPITATEQEIAENPRSRSAKLRAAQRV